MLLSACNYVKEIFLGRLDALAAGDGDELQSIDAGDGAARETTGEGDSAGATELERAGGTTAD